ncbi:MAG: SHOCT domain-containing protein, partial [Proteobacteria bacterium]|nr:SHOCT domain-containing protein [Pseudomonadota bacterium]
MSIADELSKLDELRQRGTLSDAEFARAKERLLGPEAPPPPVPPPALDAVN